MAGNMENMSDAAQRREKHKRSFEKKKEARECQKKLRGIYFIDPTDAQFKETIKNVESKHGETCSSSGTRKTTHTCIVVADESTRNRLRGTLST